MIIYELLQQNSNAHNGSNSKQNYTKLVIAPQLQKSVPEQPVGFFSGLYGVLIPKHHLPWVFGVFVNE